MRDVPIDLAILSKTPVEVSADLLDVLRKLHDALPAMRITTTMADTADRSHVWIGKGCSMELRNTQEAGVELRIEYVEGLHPILHRMSAGPIGLTMPGAHLDVERHPFACIGRLSTGRYDETRELLSERERRMTIIARAFIERSMELAAMAADGSRRLPKDMIDPLRRRLLSVAASCRARADEGMQVEQIVAYCAGPDAPMRAIATSPVLAVGHRDMLDDEERIRWQSGFPPVIMLTGTTPDSLCFDTPHFGWIEGSPIELMRAIGANQP